jgi:hypothetical protein
LRSTASTAKHDLYVNAFYNAAKNVPNGLYPGLTKKLIFYGVKMVNTKPDPQFITEDEAIRDFQFAETIQTLIGTLTPAEFVNMFPITKDFDGHRYGTKDYFYTRDFIRTLSPDEPIGDLEAVMNFLWEYHNWEVRIFFVNVSTSYVDNLCRLEGQPTAWESFCDDNGISTYTFNTDKKGKQFMVDNETGKSVRVKKRIPRYLKVIK